jgi:hypothetical protein
MSLFRTNLSFRFVLVPDGFRALFMPGLIKAGTAEMESISSVQRSMWTVGFARNLSQYRSQGDITIHVSCCTVLRRTWLAGMPWNGIVIFTVQNFIVLVLNKLQFIAGKLYVILKKKRYFKIFDPNSFLSSAFYYFAFPLSYFSCLRSQPH